MDISKLFEYGVGIAGIAGMVLIVGMFMKFLTNHFSDATRASQKLSDSIDEMLRYFKKH